MSTSTQTTHPEPPRVLSEAELQTAAGALTPPIQSFAYILVRNKYATAKF